MMDRSDRREIIGVRGWQDGWCDIQDHDYSSFVRGACIVGAIGDVLYYVMQNGKKWGFIELTRFQITNFTVPLILNVIQPFLLFN